VHRRDENEPFADSRFGATFVDLVGDVDYFLPLLRVEGEVGSVGLHVSRRAQPVAKSATNRPRAMRIGNAIRQGL